MEAYRSGCAHSQSQVNAKLWACVIILVLLAHFAVLHIIDVYRQMSAPRELPPEPTFRTAVIHYHDEHGVEVKRVQEFTVPTQLADDETLAKLPPPSIVKP